MRYARKPRDARARGRRRTGDGGTKREREFDGADDGRRAARARGDARDATTTTTTTDDARATTTTATTDDARGEANARGLEIVREALEAADAATDDDDDDDDDDGGDGREAHVRVQVEE